MATIAVKLTVIFTLFIISEARSPFNLPANEFYPSIVTSSESDTNNKDTTTVQTIRLPSEKSSESDAVSIDVLSDSDPSTTTTITSIGVAEPIKIRYDVNFRPINRHLHRHHMHVKGTPFWFRFPHHCRHHHHLHHERPMVEKQFTGRQEISYGNDMLLSDKTPVGLFHGHVGQIPARWGAYHGQRFPFMAKSFEFNVGSLTKKSGHVEVEEKERTREEENGFVKRVRKFLSNRFQI